MDVDQRPIIALISFDKETSLVINKCNFNGAVMMHFINATELISIWQVRRFNIAAIISKTDILSDTGITNENIFKKKLPRTPIFLLVNHFNDNLRKIAIDKGIFDVFEFPLNIENIETRVNFTINNWGGLQNKFNVNAVSTYRTPIGKRIFDIIFSGLALLFLSPIFLLVYLFIKLESKGPAFYYSFRVGTGYRVFKFYKFRSMYINADQRLKDLKHLNQYTGTDAIPESILKNEKNLCLDCYASGKCQFPLYADNTTMCEKDYMNTLKSGISSAFIKIKDDPRVTKVGNFIRNSSIDELPQLWNVFIGNMSIVGNRPLPLYEAEKLTTDKNALRFNAPAGITGLWQVEKRGKGGMSEEERLFLDNSYALNHSFKNDLIVILKTFPALLQKENV